MTDYRSVSPQAVADESEHTEKKSGFGRLASVFSFSHTEDERPTKPIFNEAFMEQELGVLPDEPLMNDFSSLKKKRMSLQGHPQSGLIPRTTTLNNNFGGIYNAYFSNIQTTREELANDVERRMSTVYTEGFVKDGAVEEPVDTSSTRDGSPILAQNSFQRESSFDSESQNMDLEVDFVDEKVPYVIEHEFAPLYQDDDGNLVRPPFINIDPRERYQLLQLKKSIEASESLQRRIKYMVNPNETRTIAIPHRKMVETSTQTHDAAYLDSKLSYAKRLRMSNSHTRTKRSAETSGKPSKRAKMGGSFTADFYYDIKKVESTKPKNKLDGYLAGVVKPTFKKVDPAQPIAKAHDEDTIHQFAGQNHRSTSQRIGLDQALLNNSKLNLKLDKSYVKSKDNVIKLKEDGAKSKKSLGPSSGFTFNTHKDIINGEKRDDTIQDEGKTNETKAQDVPLLSESKPQAPSTFSFGKTTDAPKIDQTTEIKESSQKEVPKFSFGKTEEKDSTSTSKFQFGAKPAEPNETTKFSFGAKAQSEEAPKFSFGAKPVDTAKINEPEEKKEALKFSFGKKDVTAAKPVSTEAPKFSFGKQQGTSEAPKFAFGKTDTTEPPKFSFGSKPDTPSDKPKLNFSFGEKKDDLAKPDEPAAAAPAPKFSFGKPAEPNEAKSFSFDKPTGSENGDGKAKPAPFTFGGFGKTESKTPSASTAPPVLATNGPITAAIDPPPFTLNSGAVEKAAPQFSFGGTAKKDAAAAETSTTPTPSFSFKSDNKRDLVSEADPIAKKARPFVFGASESSGFSFGTPKETPVSKPAFAFGNDTPKPAFSFGEKPIEDKKPATPGFSFAAGATPVSFGGASSAFPAASASPSAPGFPGAASVPSFTFGKAASNTPVTLAPIAAPANNGFKFASGASTPFAANLAGGQGFRSGSTTPNQFAFGGTPASSGFAKPPQTFGAPMNNNQFAGNTSFGQTPNFASSTNMSNMNNASLNGSMNMNNGMNNGINPQAPGVGQANAMNTPSFNFTGTMGSREGTPDPASIFGSGGAPSGNPSFGFTGAPNGAPPRKILQPRRRR